MCDHCALLYENFSCTNNGTYIRRLRNNLFNYTTFFDPNGSSSGVFSYTFFTIELQCEIRTFPLTYIGHKRSHA
jgi:hypothetical protein